MTGLVTKHGAVGDVIAGVYGRTVPGKKLRHVPVVMLVAVAVAAGVPAAETALGYLPHSSEIADAVVFFASPLAKCVTGTALPVNAGHWMPPSA